MAKVFIGVGHGGKDPGAVANGLKEKDLTLTIAKSCRDELKRHGVAVAISRDTDASENLSQRIKEANAYNPDIAVDIHINAGGGDGAEVFHAKKDKSDDTLAKNILDAIVKIGQNSRGLKTKTLADGRDYFGFIRQINAPLGSVLVECAFIDTKKDIAIIDTTAEQKAMGVAIAKGILKTLGITWKAVQSFKPYLVKVTASVLNVRAGAGLNYKVKTTVKRDEVYTIVEVKNGWGKLKSGAGWISLDYTKKL